MTEYGRGLAELGRFSEPALLVLVSLADGPKHGYAIMQDVLGFYRTRIEPGTLYGVLSRLEARGWIKPMRLDARRRPYRLTQLGTRVLKTHLTAMRGVVETAVRRLAPSGAALS